MSDSTAKLPLLLLRSTSRNFPLDLSPDLEKSGYKPEISDSLDDFIASPARAAPFLALLEVGSVADLDRALIVIDWCEQVQPMAQGRFLLLMGSKNLPLGEKAHRLGGNTEIAVLPQPARNLLFKLELQGRLLASQGQADRRKNGKGFAAGLEEAGAGNRRVLVARGQGEGAGRWQSAEASPQGKVRWRWIRNPEKGKPQEEDEFRWLAESQESPRFDKKLDAWIVEGAGANLVCLRGDTQIYSALEQAEKQNREKAKPPRKEAEAPKKAEEPGTGGETKHSPGSAEGKSPPGIPAPEHRNQSNASPPSGGGQREKKHAPKEASSSSGMPEKKNKTSSVSRLREIIEKNAAASRSQKQSKSDPFEEPEESVLGEAISLPTPAVKVRQIDYEKLVERERPGGDDSSKNLREEKKSPKSELSIKLDPPVGAQSSLRERPNSGPAPDGRKEPVPSLSQEGPPKAEGNPPAREGKASTPVPSSFQGLTPQSNTQQDHQQKERNPPGKDPATAPVPPSSPHHPPTTEPLESKAEQSSAIPSIAPTGIDPPAPESVAPVSVSSENPVPGSPAATANPSGQASAPTASPAPEAAAASGTPAQHPVPPETSRSQAAASATEEKTVIPSLPPLLPQTSVHSSSKDPLELEERRASGRLAMDDGRQVVRATAPAKEAGDSREFLKNRLFLLMTLAELGDKDSSWHPVGKYRVYLSAQHRYYGLPHPGEVLPLWIYEGELAPEFIDEKKCWKFYDRLPMAVYSVGEMPPEVAEQVYRMAGMPPPGQDSVALGTATPSAGPAEGHTLLPGGGAEEGFPHAPKKRGPWGRVMDLVKKIFVR